MTKVALILDPEFGDKVVDIASEMSVWVLSSSANSIGIQQARKKHPNQQITELMRRESESGADLLARALLDLDEHCGPASASVPYEGVLVYGVKPDDVTSELAGECGFTAIEPRAHGFVAWK